MNSESNFSFEPSPEAKTPFDAGDILSKGREKFQARLDKADLRVLIGYIEIYGGDIDKIEGLSPEWKEKIKKEKKKRPGAMATNPKLFFMTKPEALAMAIQELFKRMNPES